MISGGIVGGCVCVLDGGLATEVEARGVIIEVRTYSRDMISLETSRSLSERTPGQVPM